MAEPFDWTQFGDGTIPIDATEQGGWNGPRAGDPVPAGYERNMPFGYDTGPYAWSRGQPNIGITDPGQNGMIAAPIDPNNFPGLKNTDTGVTTGATGRYAPQQQGGDPQQIYQQIMGGANDQASLLAHRAELEAAGFEISPPNAEGKISKVRPPGGDWTRVIGEGEGHPVWIPQGGGGGGMNSGEMSAYGVPQNQYASAQFGGNYQTPAIPQSLANPYAAPQWTGGDFQAPQLNETTDPGYQARFDLQQRGLERSAAGNGTILNGGTQEATAKFGQDYASNEYDKVFGRAFDQYKMKYGQFSDDASRGLQARQQNQGEFQQNVLAPAQTQYQNQYQQYLGENARTLNDYLTNYTIGRTGVQDFLNQNNKTADRGLQATIAGRPA